MKELLNDHKSKNKDKKGFLKKATAILGGVALLTACDQQPQIAEGDVYQKEYTKHDLAFFGGNSWAGYREEDREVVSTPPTHEEISIFDKEFISRHRIRRDENWKVYIAQCPTAKFPPPDKIEKECKTNSFDVPQEVYNSLQLGQHTDFKKAK